MKVICGIYKITSPNGKIYVGQSKNIYNRWLYYKQLKCKNQKYLYHSLKKYGYNNHILEIIEICEQIHLNERELYYINLFDCLNTGLNLVHNFVFGENMAEEKRKRNQRKKKKYEIQKRYLLNREMKKQEYLRSDEYLYLLRTVKSPLFAIKMPKFHEHTQITDEERASLPF